MVSFQQTPKPRNYLARREQWRLLLLVFSLGLVAMLIYGARDPANFAWITALDPQAGGRDVGTTPGDDSPIDNRIPPPTKRDEIPGSFISPAPVALEQDDDEGYFPGVKSSYLATIRDDTTFRYDERDAWFNLLDILNKTDESTLQQASTGRATFAQLFKQSRDYRGELVTVLGTIRRAHLLTVPKNDFGIKKYYQTWLQPVDNRSSPMVIYCLHLPPGFPTGMKVDEDVEVTGFYFKRWAYKAQDSLRTAPTLVARTVHWRKRTPAGSQTPTDPVTLLVIFGTAIVVSLAVVVYVYVRTGSQRLPKPRPPSNT